MSRGAPKAPITYEGEYDAARTYLPRQVVHVTAGAARTGYLSTATTTGVAPTADPAIWLPLSGGDSTHPGTAALTLQVGEDADASAVGGTAVGAQAEAKATSSTAVGLSAIIISTGLRSTAIGKQSYIEDPDCVAVGDHASTGDAKSVALGVDAGAMHLRSVALGWSALTTENDQAMVRANSLELAESNGTAGTTLVVKDTVTGVRQRISVASGVLTVAAA